MGGRIRIRDAVITILIALSLHAGPSAPRPSEGQVLVAGVDAAGSGQIGGPEGGADPLRCAERVAIPEIENAIEATWSPGGTHLAFTRIVASTSRRTITGYEEDPGLAILELGTGAIRRLGDGSRPKWSAGGHYLSFWRTGRLFIVHAGRVIDIVEPTMPEVRWVGDQLVYFRNDDIRGWTAADDVVISTVSWEHMPRFPRDWTEFSADGALFTLTRYHYDGRAERYVGETRTGQLAPLDSAGTTYTEWAPFGQTLLVRSDETVELRGPEGWAAAAPLSAFGGRVHGWTPDGRSLLMGKVTPTVPAGTSFDRFTVWDGKGTTDVATLPNLLGSRTFSPDGRFFVGVARTGLYETALEVYRCGARAASASRADPVARARQQRIEADPRRFARPVIGYFSQFLQGAHTGVDIAAPFGAIITAADEGEVTFVGWRPVGGRAVCVQHRGELESCYYHTSLAFVSLGQHVARGEPVAAIGMTGFTTGPHVHWDAKHDGRYVDPLKR